MVIGYATRKAWTIPASLGLELLLVGAAVAVPFIYTEALPPVQLARFIMAPSSPAPPPLEPMARAAHAAATSAAPALQPVFREPSRIPTQIAAIVDEPPAPSAAVASCSNCVVGGTGAMSNMLDSLIGKPSAPAAPKAAETPKLKSVEPVRVSKGVQEAKLIKQVIPPYPRMAVIARISGTVHLVGVIARDGTIQSLQVISGPPLLSQAALEAVRQWRYKPTLLNGETVEVIAPIDVNFILGQ